MSVNANLSTLRRESLTVALVGCGSLVLLGAGEPKWTLGAMAIWAWCLWHLFRGLEDNRGEDGGLIAHLGWPTGITLLRGGLLAVAAGFLFLPPSLGGGALLPAAAYTAAVLLDHADGLLARALGRTTRLGARLDLEYDAAGILVASLLGIHYVKLPLWYAAIGLARYGFVLALWWRTHRGLAVAPLDPSRLRRVLAGVQMGFLAVSLWPFVPPPASLFAAPFFAGATAAMFLRDFWYVSGRPAASPSRA